MTRWRIFHKSVTGSTNEDACGGQPGDVFTADSQTAGRGRIGHRWLSSPGVNLMMSAVIDVSGVDPQEAATLPLTAGLSAAEAVCACTGFSSGAVKLKWPNDVLIDGRKVCGILCERKADIVIAGIGINVNQMSFPPEISSRATSLRLETGKKSDVEEVRDAVLRRLSVNLARWRESGFSALLPDIAGYDALKGRRVCVSRTDDDPLPASGMCGGIRPDGTLDVGGEAVSAGEAHVVPDRSAAR